HIRFTSTSDSSSEIDHLIIRFAGNDGFSGNDYGAVRFENASATIRNSVFTKNYRGIETIGTSNPTLVCNQLYGNVNFGVYNDTPANPVDALNHWWGSTSGPTHANNPGGTGQTVSDGVNYSPWGIQTCESVVTGSIYLPFIQR
ncbi:MAG: hypothetical protein KC413_00810, partial [Anaerolineales bacterium]|nr:hypothetical protein [Anaerolineales bacterium]